MMTSLVNYDSDDDGGDGGKVEYSRRTSNEDANYDNVGMEESSEESNQNQSESGQWTKDRRPSGEKDSHGNCNKSTDRDREYGSEKRHFSEISQKHSDWRNNMNESAHDKSFYETDKQKGYDRRKPQYDSGYSDVKNSHYNQDEKNVKGHGKQYKETKRRNSSDMDMDDDEEDDQDNWQSNTNSTKEQKNSGSKVVSSVHDTERLKPDYGRATVDVDLRNIYGDQKDTRKDTDYRKLAKSEETDVKADIKRRESVEKRERRDSDERRKEKERDKDVEKGDKRRDGDRDRRERRDDRHGRKRSHSPDRRRSPKHYRRNSRSPDRRRSRSPGRGGWNYKSKLEKKAAVLTKLGIELKPCSSAQGLTPQQLLGAQLKNQIQEVEAKTGITLPTYYNPGVMNPLKYAQQIQKRKLLWGNKAAEVKKPEAPEPQTIKQWQATTFKGDQDGKMTEKFKRLMGIKGAAAAASAAAAAEAAEASAVKPQSKEIIEKQEEMFSNMEAQYQVARMATHTHRGIGLGFGTFQVPPR